MKRARWLLGVAVCLAGCVGPEDERIRDYNADGVFLFQQGDYRSARESFQAALDLKLDDPALLYNLGQCYDRVGGDTKAERYYNDCLQRTPNHVACRHALAALLLRQGRQGDAVRVVGQWMESEPKSADPYALDGWLWHQKGDLPRAQGRLQQALDIDPHNVRALTELGVVYEEMKRPDRALVLYERVLETAPKDTEMTRRVNALLTSGAKPPQPD